MKDVVRTLMPCGVPSSAGYASHDRRNADCRRCAPRTLSITPSKRVAIVQLTGLRAYFPRMNYFTWIRLPMQRIIAIEKGISGLFIRGYHTRSPISTILMSISMVKRDPWCCRCRIYHVLGASTPLVLNRLLAAVSPRHTNF